MKFVLLISLLVGFSSTVYGALDSCPNSIEISNFNLDGLFKTPEYYSGSERIDSDDVSEFVQRKWQVEPVIPQILSLVTKARLTGELRQAKKITGGYSCFYHFKGEGEYAHYAFDYKTQKIYTLPMASKTTELNGFGSLVGANKNAKFYFELYKFGDIPHSLNPLTTDFYAATVNPKHTKAYDNTQQQTVQHLKAYTWHQVANDFELFRMHSSHVSFDLKAGM